MQFLKSIRLQDVRTAIGKCHRTFAAFQVNSLLKRAPSFSCSPPEPRHPRTRRNSNICASRMSRRISQVQTESLHKIFLTEFRLTPYGSYVTVLIYLNFFGTLRRPKLVYQSLTAVPQDVPMPVKRITCLANQLTSMANTGALECRHY